MIKPIENGLNKFANSHIVKKHINKCIENKNFLTKTLLVTSVSKDVFAYALRVHNTMKNDEIPKDKKSFVAKMDATTGFTTAIVQVGTGLALASEKVQKTICKHLFKGLDENSKLYKQASSGLGVVLPLVGATLFAKRILVPLISSPIAGYLENKHNKNQNTVQN